MDDFKRKVRYVLGAAFLFFYGPALVVGLIAVLVILFS